MCVFAQQFSPNLSVCNPDFGGEPTSTALMAVDECSFSVASSRPSSETFSQGAD